MSQEAKATAEIHFNGVAGEKILAWIAKANAGKHTGKNKGQYAIDVTSNYGTGLDLELNSVSEQNLQWQIDRLYDFLHKIPEVEEFSTAVWIKGEGRSFYRGEE